MLLLHQDYKSASIVREPSIVYPTSKKSAPTKKKSNTLSKKNKDFLKSIGLTVKENKKGKKI